MGRLRSIVGWFLTLVILTVMAYFILSYTPPVTYVTFSNVSIQMNYPYGNFSNCLGNSIYNPRWTAQKNAVDKYNFTLTDGCTGTQIIRNITVGDGLKYSVIQPTLPYGIYAIGNKVPVVINITIPSTEQGGTLHVYVNAT